MKTLIITSFLIIFCFPGTLVIGQPLGGDPDETIAKLVQKIGEYPKNKKKIQELQAVYNGANQEDINRIKELKASGQPDVWYEIYKRYARLDLRQKKVSELPESVLNSISYRKTDWAGEMDESRDHAAAYLYAHASKLLSGNDVQSARNAYDELMMLAGIVKKYRDLDELIRKAVLVGAESIRFELYNKTGQQLDDKIIDDLSQLVRTYKHNNLGQKQDEKVTGPYFFTIQVVLTELTVTPDQMKTVKYREERDVYRDGKVSDTIGVDVTEYHQRKVADMTGFISYIDNSKGQLINKAPLSVSSYFTNVYASIQGNPDACGEETMKLIQNKQQAYPSNGQIVMDIVDKFTKNAGSIIFGSEQEKPVK
jgi:hypothetical protein